MCGICGIIHDDPDRPIDRDLLAAMNATMVHRGPDDEGHYVGRGAGLAMRRLSIIDVAGGHQPMLSEEGSVVAVCNGELYNFHEIRSELEGQGHAFRTHSDVEILPHLYEAVGAATPERLNGMFGLAVWDERERTLLLARDRMGQKPLYWTQRDGMLLFASELKVLLAHPAVAPVVDRAALAKYLAFEYVPAPHAIIAGVHKLEAGHRLVWKRGAVTVEPYWTVPMGDDADPIDEGEAAERLRALLKRSVERRLISDVPLGVFLSGGIDSSSIVAMMAELRPPEQIKTFSIAFAEESFDESSYAREVAERFGTDHREQRCTPEQLMALLPAVTDLLDEPLGDASIVPTYALSKFTREHVTVALGGDGGDELFAGYPTFPAEEAARLYRSLPGFLRRGLIEPLARRLPVSDDNISFDFKVKQFLKGAAVRGIERHIHWLGSFTPAEQGELLLDGAEDDPLEDVARYAAEVPNASPGNRLLYTYKRLYLAEDILTKVDRASMGVSLEARAPFLDPEFVACAAALPYRLKLRGRTMKYVLKRAMDPLLPKGIAGRAKKGFGIPVAKWVKGPLKDLFRETLAVDRIRREGYFRPGAVSKLLRDHFEGRADNRKKLWTLFIFERWLERWGR